MTQLMIDCPQCNGDGFISFGDRHVENAKEVCSTCNGHQQIPARTGETPETSAPMSIPTCAITDAEFARLVIKTPTIKLDDPRDPVVEAVRADLLRRSQFGLRKYGTPLSRTDLDLRAWLNHAYEEALDMANYLKRSIMELDVSELTPVQCADSDERTAGALILLPLDDPSRSLNDSGLPSAMIWAGGEAYDVLRADQTLDLDSCSLAVGIYRAMTEAHAKEIATLSPAPRTDGGMTAGEDVPLEAVRGILKDTATPAPPASSGQGGR